MGPTLVAIAAAMLVNFASFPELAEQISRDPGVIFLSETDENRPDRDRLAKSISAAMSVLVLV
jgi:hypothetical protein